MVKSLEEYLSDLSFAPPESQDAGRVLNAGEKAFVEKYLGLDMLRSLPRVDPEVQPLLQAPPPPPSSRVIYAEPEIHVAAPKIIVAPKTTEIAPPATEKQPDAVATKTATPVIVEAKAAHSPVTSVTPKPVQVIQTEKHTVSSVPASVKTASEATISVKTEQEPAPAPPVRTAQPLKVEAKLENPVRSETARGASTQIQQTAAAPEQQIISLRDALRNKKEVQVVSFFVQNQLFLLPVDGIQEVLRRMELIRLPQAPLFVAGVINLRGKVTPLIHLSALLTNSDSHIYDEEKHFIIVCGTVNLQIGLIIDRINSMHMLSVDKIIWNVESRLGDSGEYLSAIANLDGKVCGIVAPEMITQKILSTSV